MIRLSNEKRFYVYGYVRLDSNTYFYVGKGTGKRYKELYTGRTKHFKNIINSIPCAVEILYDNLTEEESLILEQDFIEDLVFNEGYTMEFDIDKNKNGYHLINCTYGGEGISGYKYTEEQRKNVLDHKNKMVCGVKKENFLLVMDCLEMIILKIECEKIIHEV